MPPVASNSPFRLRMKINLRKSRRGWTEDYWMVAADPALTLQRAEHLCYGRVLFLATNFYLEYASLSRASSTRDSYACNLDGANAFPLAFSPAQNLDYAANDIEAGWEFRFQTADKRWNNRIFRGVPDEWIKNILAAPVGTLLVNPVGPFVTALPYTYVNPRDDQGNLKFSLGTQPLSAYQKDFLQAVTSYTGLVNHIPPESTAPGANREAWTVTPFTQCRFNQVSSHRTGQGYGAGRARAKKRV